jgi:hypothetical protein
VIEHTFDIMGTMFNQLVEHLSELADAALDERIRNIELQRRALDAELAAAIRLADTRQIGAIDGHRTINSYLRATLNCSTRDAARLRSHATAVTDIDGLGQAWATGRIGQAQIARFATLNNNRRVRHQLPEFTPILLEHAEQLSYNDFSQCVDRFMTLADQDGAHDERDHAVKHRDAHISAVGNAVDITAHGGDALTTSELIAIHQRFVDTEYQTDLETRRNQFGDHAEQHPLPRTAGQRRFDALATILRTAANAKNVGSTADPLVNIVIDADTWSHILADTGLAPTTSLDRQPIDPFTGLSRPSDLLTELTGSPEQLTNRRCETTNGITLHPHDVLRAALAGHTRRVIIDSASVVIDMGRRRRLFQGPAREAAKLLAQHCEHPGCELPTDLCDVDHNNEWANHGTTNQSNSRIRCGPHNTDKTRHHWQSKRATNGHTYTIRTNGTIMLPTGTRPPTFPDEDADDPADIAHLTNLTKHRAANLRTT